MLLKPGIENEEYFFMFSGFDKFLHFSIFMFLGWCIKTAFPKLKFITYTLYSIAYGAITEILQEIMQLGRSMELLDFIVDLIGALVAYFSFPFFQRIIHIVFRYFRISNP